MSFSNIDPFDIKLNPKWHPNRLLFTLRARLRDRSARRSFKSLELPPKRSDKLPIIPHYDRNATAVTHEQMAHLLEAVRLTENLAPAPCVEIGSFRGETTAAVARITSRRVFAVDPFIGYGGAAEDKECFKNTTDGQGNIIHVETTSGDAFRSWKHGLVSFVFVDAVHDYVNTRFDGDIWKSLLVPGGVISFHDTDDVQFAGTRRAVFELAKHMEVLFHVPGFVALRKPA